MKSTLAQTVQTIMFISLVSIFANSVEAQDIQPYRAEEVKPYKAEEVKPNKTREVKPYKARVVKPDQARPVRKNRTQVVKATEVPVVTPEASKEVVPTVEKSKPNNSSAHSGMDDLFGIYQYWVPGASYTTHDYTNQQLVLHNSAGSGVLPGGISINKDQTYVWNSSWDEKVIRGNWRTTGDPEYPIVLLNAQEGKSWKVGKSVDDPAIIVVWDGSTWYNGKKIR